MAYPKPDHCIEKPDYCTNEMLEYLDDLGESGITNMFGARPYIQKAFNLGKKQASKVLSYWMKSFDRENR